MIKVLPKSASSWKAYNTAVIGVSLSSKNHIGPAFAGLMNWVGNNFDSCIIDLSDSLHRYNVINDHHSVEEAHSITQAQGSAWLRDHALIIDATPIPTTVIRWDHWLSHPDFQKHFDAFKIAAETQPDFHATLMQDIHHFNLRRNIEPDQASAAQLQHSLNYLLEELAAHSILYAQTPCAVVYPGKDHESFKMARLGKIKNVPNGHINSCFTRMVVYNFGNESVPPTAQNAESNSQAA